MQEAIWIIEDAPAKRQVEEVSREFGIRPLVARLLLQRGFSEPEEIARFLHPRLQDLADPFLLPDMQQAVDRVLQAIDAQEPVLLYGDYDVDGVTSLTLMAGVLEAYGLAVRTFLPHRMDEGYGLNQQALERCLAEEKPSLIIAVDCGTSSLEEIRDLKEAGIDVVVLDHHECHATERPPAVALVNPKLGDDFHYLCSAGVVFKLAHAMLKSRRLDGLDLREWLDIVALGTVADLVPLVGENRTLVRKGLVQLDRSDRPGIEALKAVSGLRSRPESSDIGFRLGPRLNAAGRLDTAQASLDLLRCVDNSQAQQLAGFLDGQNRSRQDLEFRIREEAYEKMEGFDPETDSGIVLASEDWHPGVVGIVASRISRSFHRPTFIIAVDEKGVGKGSGRSVPGVSLVDAIEHCRELLEAGGGHEMAAGISIRQENIETFRERFQTWIHDHTGPEVLKPRLRVDAVVSFEELNLDLLDSYELIHPLGMGNPQPTFMAKAVRVMEEPRVMKERHLRLRLSQKSRTVDAIYFNSADLDLPRPPWDIAFTINRNVYRGRSSLNMVIESVRSTE